MFICLYSVYMFDKNKLKIFAALSDSSRIRIVSILSKGELSVQDIALILGQSQPRVSRHIRILEDANLIIKNKEGGWVFCKLNRNQEIEKIIDFVCERKESDKDLSSIDFKRLLELQHNRVQVANDFFYNQYKDQYYIDSINKYNDQSIDEQIVGILSKNIKIPFNNLIDLGTGSGKILSLLSKLSNNCIGVDNNHSILKMARARICESELSNCEIRYGDITKLDLAKESADLTILHQVLHYFDNPDSLIEEAVKLLRKDKYILIVDFEKHQNEFLRKDFSHRRLGFHDEQIIEMFNRFGCKLIDKTKGVSVKGPNIDELIVKVWLGMKGK
jgi:DNA-binding transcriptional ArsR family regulator/ubiquinone/menaquinone biosynthesis C-methylase UbiE